MHDKSKGHVSSPAFWQLPDHCVETDEQAMGNDTDAMEYDEEKVSQC